MSNGEEKGSKVVQVDRALRLSTKVCMMVMDGVRDSRKVADYLQEIVSDNTGRFDPDKFALFVDLGTITVPDDYVHRTRLAMFKERHQGGKKKSFYFYNDDITDEHFPNPSRVLLPGQKLQVCAFNPVVPGTTTSEERMAYLETQRMAVYTGAQGASLVFDQKCDQMPKGKWYISFDEAERLWKDTDGHYLVSGVLARSGGDFSFGLGDLENDRCDSYAFLGFRDLPGEASVKADAK